MNDPRPKTGLDLSLIQVVAGTGGALIAALLGTAVGTVCNAVYAHQLRRTHDRLQRSSTYACRSEPLPLVTGVARSPG